MSEKKFWGWGYEDFEIAPTLLEQYKTMLQFSLGIKEFVEKPIPELIDIELRTPRFSQQQKKTGQLTPMANPSGIFGEPFTAGLTTHLTISLTPKQNRKYKK